MTDLPATIRTYLDAPDAGTALTAFAPAAVCVLSALIFVFYHIDEKELDAWRAEQAAKKAAAK